MKKHFKYLKYILTHKYYTFLQCCKFGIPLRGILHDISKFYPTEWFPYVSVFGVDRTPRGDDGSYNPIVVATDNDAYGYAWLYHIHRNKHHWQFWFLLGDGESERILEMPDIYIKEMVADWYGAGMAQNGNMPVNEWYEKNKFKIRLGKRTRVRIEQLLNELDGE